MSEKNVFIIVITERGYELTEPPSTKGMYLPVRNVGTLFFTSGTGCNIKGVRYYTGKVGGNVSLEEAQESARVALLNNISNFYAVFGE